MPDTQTLSETWEILCRQLHEQRDSHEALAQTVQQLEAHLITQREQLFQREQACRVAQEQRDRALETLRLFSPFMVDVRAKGQGFLPPQTAERQHVAQVFFDRRLMRDMMDFDVAAKSLAQELVNQIRHHLRTTKE